MIQTSFIVPSFHSRATLGRVLRGIADQRASGRFEVWVVESSEDGSADWIRSNHPEVKVWEAKRRLSPAEARNRGAAAATGELLAFIDADAIPEPAWLETLRCELDRPDTRLVGGYIRNANPETRSSRVLHWIEFSQYLPGDDREARVISSSNMLMRRQDFERLGGFDPSWKMAEDLKFCLQSGSGIRFCGRTGVAHVHREDWSEVRVHLQRLGYWSGRLRAAGMAPGAWLRRLPAASGLLLPLRAARITSRVLRAGGINALQYWTDLPALSRGLWCWLRGFRRGLREGAAERRPSGEP